MLKIYHCDAFKILDEDFKSIYLNSDEDRKKKADKIKNTTKRKLSILAEDLVKNAISENFTIEKSDVSLRVGKNGKPYAENIDAEFSISHSGNVVVCAVSDKPVGIDIEKIRDVNESVARRLFTEDERDYVFRDGDFSKERFFEIWTRKEAYVKMMGEGLSYFLKFSSVGDENIKTYIKNKYVVSVATSN